MGCKNCKQWEKLNTNFGCCNKIIANDWVGVSDDTVSINARSKDRSEVKDYDAVISIGDGHSDSVRLITGSSFSCLYLIGNYGKS